MTPVAEKRSSASLPWTNIAWFGILFILCYAPSLQLLVKSWDDPDMGHGYFVPIVAGWIVWQRRDELAALQLKPNWWGLLLVFYGNAQVIAATLGMEGFLERTGLVITLIGIVFTLGGTELLRRLFFPLALLFFMIPIPAVIYYRITFPLQFVASKLATDVLSLIGVPVLREGNILELPNQRLSVVEACSGIRSLLSLTFLSLVYGYFFEERKWVRAVLFVGAVPIAILANGGRVSVTGIMSQIRPELAEGFFHESTGWVIFMIAIVILVLFHRVLLRLIRLFQPRTAV